LLDSATVLVLLEYGTSAVVELITPGVGATSSKDEEGVRVMRTTVNEEVDEGVDEGVNKRVDEAVELWYTG
jgi:hypothetical protein